MIVWLASSFSCSPWSPWSQSLLRGKAGQQRVVARLPGAALRKGGKNVQPGCGGEAIPHRDQPTSGRLSWEDREHAGRDLWSREQCSETWPASRPIWAPLPLTTQSGPASSSKVLQRLLLLSQPTSQIFLNMRSAGPNLPPTHPSTQICPGHNTHIFSGSPTPSQLPTPEHSVYDLCGLVLLPVGLTSDFPFPLFSAHTAAKMSCFLLPSCHYTN